MRRPRRSPLCPYTTLVRPPSAPARAPTPGPRILPPQIVPIVPPVTWPPATPHSADEPRGRPHVAGSEKLALSHQLLHPHRTPRHSTSPRTSYPSSRL